MKCMYYKAKIIVIDWLIMMTWKQMDALERAWKNTPVPDDEAWLTRQLEKAA